MKTMLFARSMTALFVLIAFMAFVPDIGFAGLEQVGAYFKKENAEKAAEKLNKEGKESVVKKSFTDDGKAIYRVFVQRPDAPDKDVNGKGAKSQDKKAPKKAAPSGAVVKGDIKLRIIFVRTGSEAREILDEIKGGGKFALLAKKRSLDDKTRNAYGYLGDVEIATLDGPMKEAVLGLKRGRTSGVIKLQSDLFALVQHVDMSNYERGEKHFRSGKYEDAEKSLRKHIGLNPDAFKTYIMLGKIYEIQESYGDAEKMYRSAREFKPDREEPYTWLGRLYLKMKRYKEARDIFADGIRRNPYSKRLQEGIELADLLLMSDEH